MSIWLHFFCIFVESNIDPLFFLVYFPLCHFNSVEDFQKELSQHNRHCEETLWPFSLMDHSWGPISYSYPDLDFLLLCAEHYLCKYLWCIIIPGDSSVSLTVGLLFYLSHDWFFYYGSFPFISFLKSCLLSYMTDYRILKDKLHSSI